MYNAKAYRLVQLDGRGPWESSPRRTVTTISGQEWLAETFAVVLRAFGSAGGVDGVTEQAQYQDARERWWDMSPEEVSTFIDNV
jgi:hypothetical protein